MEGVLAGGAAWQLAVDRSTVIFSLFNHSTKSPRPSRLMSYVYSVAPISNERIVALTPALNVGGYRTASRSSELISFAPVERSAD